MASNWLMHEITGLFVVIYVSMNVTLTSHHCWRLHVAEWWAAGVFNSSAPHADPCPPRLWILPARTDGAAAYQSIRTPAPNNPPSLVPSSAWCHVSFSCPLAHTRHHSALTGQTGCEQHREEAARFDDVSLWRHDWRLKAQKEKCIIWVHRRCWETAQGELWETHLCDRRAWSQILVAAVSSGGRRWVCMRSTTLLTVVKLRFVAASISRFMSKRGHQQCVCNTLPYCCAAWAQFLKSLCDVTVWMQLLH